MERSSGTRTRLPNPLGIIGGVVALISLVLPWLALSGADANVNLNLPRLVSLLANENVIFHSPPYLLQTVVLATVLVTLGGIASLAHPLGGIIPVIGAVLFLAVMPLAPGSGPYTALVGGLVALSGLALRKSK